MDFCLINCNVACGYKNKRISRKWRNKSRHQSYTCGCPDSINYFQCFQNLTQTVPEIHLSKPEGLYPSSSSSPESPFVQRAPFFSQSLSPSITVTISKPAEEKLHINIKTLASADFPSLCRHFKRIAGRSRWNYNQRLFLKCYFHFLTFSATVKQTWSVIRQPLTTSYNKIKVCLIGWLFLRRLVSDASYWFIYCRVQLNDIYKWVS